MTPATWRGKRVLVTGHTGFKGAWLAFWLAKLDAKVHGLALSPRTSPNLFELLSVSAALETDGRVDIRNRDAVGEALRKTDPEVIFHLAAHSLVRTSYGDPQEAYATNVLGTVNLMDAARQCDNLRAVVVVTTDKCYENREWVYPYREDDRLGGLDPYSSSKACAELVTQAFRDSFFSRMNSPSIASARAGNVIGGGDWSEDRLIPDCVRALTRGMPVQLRNPRSVRPWQHVFDCLMGYVELGERLIAPDGRRFAGAWNFGPDADSDAEVLSVATQFASAWNGRVESAAVNDDLHEAATLRLDSTKARVLLGWRPKWRLSRAIQETVDWYHAWSTGRNMREFSERQLDIYLNDQER